MIGNRRPNGPAVPPHTITPEGQDRGVRADSLPVVCPKKKIYRCILERDLDGKKVKKDDYGKEGWKVQKSTFLGSLLSALPSIALCDS